MARMNCRQLSEGLNEVKGKLAGLRDGLSERQDYDGSKRLTDAAEELRYRLEFLQEQMAVERIIGILEKKETWDSMDEEIREANLQKVLSNAGESRMVINGIKNYIEHIKFPPDLNEMDYLDFANKLTKMKNTLPSNDCAEASTAFLEKMLEWKDRVVIGNDLPDIVDSNFCQGLSHGKVEANFVGYGFGKYLNGGDIAAGAAGHRMGEGMEYGVIKVERAGLGAGHRAKGGVIIAGEVGDYAGDQATGLTMYVEEAGKHLGADMERGTILFESCEEIGIPNESNVSIIGHDKRGYFLRYGDTNSKMTNPDEQTIELFKSKMYGMLEFTDLPEDHMYVTGGMLGGIVVFHKAPDSEIGYGMMDGMVIIEDPDIDEEELKARLSEVRRFGVVMLRVEDENSENGTRLVRVG